MVVYKIVDYLVNINPLHLIFGLSSLYMFIFLHKKYQQNKTFVLGKFLKFGWFDMEWPYILL